MSFKEEGSVEYVEIDGKKVPVVQCEAEVKIYNSNRFPAAIDRSKWPNIAVQGSDMKR